MHKKGLRKSIYSLSSILFYIFLIVFFIVSSHIIISELRTRSETGFAGRCPHFPAGRGGAGGDGIIR